MIDYTTFIEISKLVVPAFAIMISIISLIKTNRNTRRQVRIGKLEEIIECLQFFIIHYRQLMRIHKQQCAFKFAEPHYTKDEVNGMFEEYKLLVNEFKEEVNMDKFQEKTARLRVLANSYLPDSELKLKIVSLVTLITNLINCTIYQNFASSREIYPIYPKGLDFMQYIQNVENEILKEMNLGYKGITLEKVEAYKDKFKKDLKI